MKRLLFLFPLYILFLSGVPCSPNDRCCAEELCITAPTGDKTTKDQPSNLPCSPFFPCGACHGVVIPDHKIQLVQSPPAAAKPQTLYTESPLLVFSPAIWQPPKSC